jgi:hypothetical protein
VLTYSARLRGLAENPALGAELLDRFVAGADAELCLDLAERADLTPDQVRMLATRGGPDTALRLVRRGRLGSADVDPDDPWIALALLDSDAAPPGTAERLAADPDPRVRQALALVTGLPPDLLSRLVGDASVAVVAAAAESVRRRDELATLARHPHLAVRLAVARNGHTPPATLAVLADDGGRPPARWCPGCDGSAAPTPDMPPGTSSGRWPAIACDGRHRGAVVWVETEVARNPATPPAVVAVLADHPNLSVRWAMTDRTDLPMDACRRLARDPIPAIRADIAANPAIGPVLLRELAESGSPEVRYRVAENPLVTLELLAAVASKRTGPVIVPRIAAATEAEVWRLARWPVPAVRMLLAARSNLPAAVVDLLATDDDPRVLRAVAAHPGLTEAQLRSIVDGRGSRVAVAVATNPSCPTDLLDELSQRKPSRILRAVAVHPAAPPSALLRCLRDDRARPLAARHPGLPAVAVVALLESDDERVAEEAAANPALPLSVMAALLDE